MLAKMAPCGLPSYSSHQSRPVFLKEELFSGRYWIPSYSRVYDHNPGTPLPPSISHPYDIVYSEGEDGNTITWEIYSPCPEEYEVFLDGELLLAGRWGEATLEISVDGLKAGTHNVTIVATVFCGASLRDTVFVTVQPGPTSSTSTTKTTTTAGTSTTSTTVPGTLLGLDMRLLLVLGGIIGLLAVIAIVRSRRK